EFLKQRVGNRQPETAGFRLHQELPGGTGENQARDVNICVCRDFEHLRTRPLLPAVFGNQAWDVLFAQPQLACPPLAVSEDFLPTALSEVALDGFAEHLVRLAVLFLGRSLYLFDQSPGKDQAIGMAMCFHGTSPRSHHLRTPRGAACEP